MATRPLDYTSPERAVTIERVGDATRIVRPPYSAAERSSWPSFLVRLTVWALAFPVVLFLVMMVIVWLSMILAKGIAPQDAALRIWRFRSEAFGRFWDPIRGLWGAAILLALPIVALARFSRPPAWAVHLTNDGWLEYYAFGIDEPLRRKAAGKIASVKSSGRIVIVRSSWSAIHDQREERLYCPTRESAASVAAAVREWLLRITPEARRPVTGDEG